VSGPRIRPWFRRQHVSVLRSGVPRIQPMQQWCMSWRTNTKRELTRSHRAVPAMLPFCLSCITWIYGQVNFSHRSIQARRSRTSSSSQVLFRIVQANKNIRTSNILPRLRYHLNLFRQYLTKLNCPARRSFPTTSIRSPDKVSVTVLASWPE
jgi:hypothetical protein